MSDGFAVGAFVGLTVALPASMLSVLIVALWKRRSPRVALAALGGAATIETALAMAGLALGTAIAAIASDPGFRASVAAGLLLAIVARIVLGLLMGPYGVSGQAILPTTLGGAWIRMMAVAALNPVVGLAAAALGVARPELATGAAWSGLVVGLVGAALAWRLLLAATAAGRRERRHTQLGLGLVAITLLLVFVLGLRPPG